MERNARLKFIFATKFFFIYRRNSIFSTVYSANNIIREVT